VWAFSCGQRPPEVAAAPKFKAKLYHGSLAQALVGSCNPWSGRALVVLAPGKAGCCANQETATDSLQGCVEARIDDLAGSAGEARVG
jgi:hypothetical protein